MLPLLKTYAIDVGIAVATSYCRDITPLADGERAITAATG